MELSSSQLQRRSDTAARASIQISVKAIQIILYAVAVVLLAAAIAWLFVAVAGKSLPGNSTTIALALVFWALGLAHILIYHPLLSLLQERYGWWYTILLGALVTAAVYVMFSMVGMNDWMLSATAGAAFVLPHILQQLVFNFFTIVPSSEKGWVIPAGAEADKRMSLLLNSMHFKICMRVNADDDQAYVFSVNLPARLELSMVFLRFLHDRQDEIALVDENGEDYAWQFWVVRRLGFKRLLDPSLSLKENGVKRGDIIYIERINT